MSVIEAVLVAIVGLFAAIFRKSLVEYGYRVARFWHVPMRESDRRANEAIGLVVALVIFGAGMVIAIRGLG